MVHTAVRGHCDAVRLVRVHRLPDKTEVGGVAGKHRCRQREQHGHAHGRHQSAQEV